MSVARLASATLCGLLCAGAARVHAAEPAPASGGIAWEKDFKTAARRARETGRPLLVAFWASWCRWCHELDATTYRDPVVLGLVKDFVAVKVNTEGGLEERHLTAQFGVDALPTIGFVSPGGRLFLRRTEFEAPEDFAATLRAV